jgi:serine/threonine protein kinase/membrane-associated phospholipid phosphatase
MTLTPGTKLGPYEILGSLGAGGMGEVYRARDTRLDRLVAVKVISEKLADDPGALARFEREAKAVAALSHPNILAIHDFESEGDLRYAVMELLEGETLRERLEEGPLPISKATEIATRVAEGLAAAHEKGIIHRDLKPGNVFVTMYGQVKVLDFGLARLTDKSAVLGDSGPASTTADVSTHAGAVLGTMGYMSPEQLRGLPTDPRSDIFTLGILLYEMLSGRRAFARDTTADTVSAILHEDPPELDRLAAAISVPLFKIVKRCLEKRPEDRFSSAHDLALALEAVSSAGAPLPETAVPRAKKPRRRGSRDKAQEPSSSSRPGRQDSKVGDAAPEPDSRKPRSSGGRKPRAQGEKSSAGGEARRRKESAEAALKSRREKWAALGLLGALFLVNYLETAGEAWLRAKYSMGIALERTLGEAAQWFEGGLSFEQHDATNWFAVYGYSAVYFFLFPLLAILAIVVFYRRRDSRPLLLLSTAAAVDYVLTLPFYLFFPVPERWTYPDAGAVLLSDLWTSKLIQAFRPFSGLNNCFPSFHVSTTFILAAVFYRCGFAWRATALPLAIAILLSTFALGIHWLPDILAGLAVGWLSFWLAERIFPWVEREIAALSSLAAQR